MRDMDLSCSFGSKIIIGENLDIASLIKTCLPKTCHKIAIITDANVAKYHGNFLTQQLNSVKIDHILFPFPSGEPFKTRRTKEQLEDLLIANQFNRDCAIIGFGGGVVTDLAGFIAATFARGVPFIALPTTLMGMVDATIGGKVGVNTQLAKNIIGAFYPATAVLMDTKFLSSLSEAEIKNGLAEVYKHAFIASYHLLSLLQDNAPITEIVEQSCLIKKAIVEKDFNEEGLRRILNFGHTIGHALEAASDYLFPHGFAIAAGMKAESWMSHALGYLPYEELLIIEKALSIFPPLPSLQPKKILKSLAFDKKSIKAKPRFVLLKNIGSPLPFDDQFCTDLSDELIEEAIYRICTL